MKIFSYLGRLLLFVLLTALTQVGGIVVMISWAINASVQARWPMQWPRLFGSTVFVTLYLVTSTALVPPLAKLAGRVPLPVLDGEELAPRTLWSAVLNRHYADPELDALVRDVAHDFVHSGRPHLVYLDACFPFFDGFPLLPHLSHNDGRKVDLAFCYRDGDGSGTACTPTVIGYGSFAKPKTNEDNTAARCSAQGAWWYNSLGHLPSDGSITLDEKRTRELVRAIAADPRTGKIFLEPYLKTRWGITSDKVRFHGCHAVSHADHIHVQL